MSLKCAKTKDFDFSCEMSSPHYFKSSFAKSMAVESKSLDYLYLHQINEESEKSLDQKENEVKMRHSFTSKQDGNSELRRRSLTKNSLKRHQSWINSPNRGDTDTDVIRLRKECQCLLEENRWLRSTEGAMLQTRVDTLQWQLQQAESGRLMCRQVLEQVARFLSRAHGTLETLETQTRVSRSTSACSFNMPDCRQPFSRAQSAAHVDSVPDYAAFRDFTWRRSKPQRQLENAAPEKLSKEAFRLLRTVQSVLNTREPDLVQKHSSDFPVDLEDHFHALNLTEDAGSVLDASSIHSSHSLKEDLVPEGGGIKNPPPVSSVSSNEDESGFSSMGSFQEVGLPPPPSNHRHWTSNTYDSQPSCQTINVLWV